MKELKSLLTETSKIKAELKRLDEMEANARSAIVAATDEDVTTPAAQQKIADARLSLEVMSARRSKLKPPFSALHARLQELFKGEVQAWSDQVVEAREQKTSEIARALLPFWEGDERQIRKDFDFHRVPVIHLYRKAIYTVPSYENPKDRDIVRDVGLLISHIEQWSKKLGLS